MPMSIEVDGKILETDAEGYLADLSAWEPAVAEAMAKADKQELTEEHWEVIQFLRGVKSYSKPRPQFFSL